MNQDLFINYIKDYTSFFSALIHAKYDIFYYDNSQYKNFYQFEINGIIKLNNNYYLLVSSGTRNYIWDNDEIEHTDIKKMFLLNLNSLKFFEHEVSLDDVKKYLQKKFISFSYTLKDIYSKHNLTNLEKGYIIDVFKPQKEDNKNNSDDVFQNSICFKTFDYIDEDNDDTSFNIELSSYEKKDLNNFLNQKVKIYFPKNIRYDIKAGKMMFGCFKSLRSFSSYVLAYRFLVKFLSDKDKRKLINLNTKNKLINSAPKIFYAEVVEYNSSFYVKNLKDINGLKISNKSLCDIKINFSNFTKIPRDVDYIYVNMNLFEKYVDKYFKDFKCEKNNIILKMKYGKIDLMKDNYYSNSDLNVAMKRLKKHIIDILYEKKLIDDAKLLELELK